MTHNEAHISKARMNSPVYVTTTHPGRSIDILLLTLPPVHEDRSPLVPNDILNSSIEQHPSSGLAFLATQIATRSSLVPGICYGHQIRLLGSDGRERLFGVDDLAEVCVASGARVVGLSLMSQVELAFARQLMERLFTLSQRGHQPNPVVIVGGAQATMAAQDTAAYLGLPQANVFGGRAVPELLNWLGRELNSGVNLAGLDVSDPVLPEFLMIRSNPMLEEPVTPIISVLSSGGTGCDGRPPCSFCTAYFLGSEVPVPRRQFTRQVDLMAAAGIHNCLAGDNSVNLADRDIAREFEWRVQYAHDSGLFVRHFLARPDHIAAAPSGLLARLHEQSVESVLVGVESGDVRTLRLMAKVARGCEVEFLAASKKAIERIASAGIRPVVSAIIGYPSDSGDDADLITLEFLGELRRLSRGTAQLDLHPLFVSPGSRVYAASIRRGGDHDRIAAFNTVTEREYRTVLQRHSRLGCDRISELLENGDPTFMADLMLFATSRRLALKAISGS